MDNVDAQVVEPPMDEPAGYSARPGFVKSHAENNEYYLEQYRDSGWYPVLMSTHRGLMELIPGYNISQIKMKFGSLCYYIEYPEVIPVGEDAVHSYLKTEAQVKAEVQRIIRYAEAWVDGYQAAAAEAHAHVCKS